MSVDDLIHSVDETFNRIGARNTADLDDAALHAMWASPTVTTMRLEYTIPMPITHSKIHRSSFAYSQTLESIWEYWKRYFYISEGFGQGDLYVISYKLICV